MNATGYIVYRGPSVLDDSPIVMVALMNSQNEKTGNLVQTYILVDTGERPTETLRSGNDDAICGDCKLRPVNSGACYVVVRQGATKVWQRLQQGQYPVLQPAQYAGVFNGRMIRMGTYGDPAAVPISAWKPILRAAGSWIGYTHQWLLQSAEPLRKYCMASVDTAEEKAVANARGWRTYRVRLPDEHLLSKEGICPASEEADHKLTCLDCGACDGANGRHGNIAIILHGNHTNFAGTKYRARIDNFLRSREIQTPQ